MTVTNNPTREFVSTYWPNPDTAGHKVRSMYDRLAAAAAEAASRKERDQLNEGSLVSEAPKTNGATNGVLVKQE